MMVDVQDARGAHGSSNAADAIRHRVEHDEEVACLRLALLRPPDNIISRQHREGCRDIIIKQNRDMLPQRLEEVHQAERSADGIAIGIHVCRDDHLVGGA